MNLPITDPVLQHTPDLLTTGSLLPGLVQVVYEDAHLLVVNKPAGIVVHPAYRHKDGTLFDQIRAYVQTSGQQEPPCLIHRLDKDTSGLLVLTKTEAARRNVVRQLEQGRLGKRYLALVRGIPEAEEFVITAPLCRGQEDRRVVVVDYERGQAAMSRVRLLRVLGEFSFVEVEPVTGRTHQLRVHLASVGLPIAGDSVYGAGPVLGLTRQFLHAYRLSFRHPASNSTLAFAAPLPVELESVLQQLRLPGR